MFYTTKLARTSQINTGISNIAQEQQHQTLKVGTNRLGES